MEEPNVTWVSLMTCFYTDFPDTENRTDCSISDPSNCYRCPVLGKFTTGELLDDVGGPGHIISFSLCLLGFIIALFGTVANVLIIMIIRKKPNQRPFDVLLSTLAWCDLLCCVSSVITAMSMIAYFQNMSRGLVNLWIGIYIGSLTTLYGRSLSCYTTLLIAIERYLILVFPLKRWFTKSRTRLYAISVVVWSTLMAIPRFSSIYIRKNDFGQDVPSLKNFDYVFFPTSLEYFWYVTLNGFFDTIDFWFPLPLLLIFNGLIYMHIRQFAKSRKELNKNVRKDINAASMFVPVVVVLFLCNIEPIIHYFYIINGVIYREHYCGVLLSLAVNSSFNLAIYYFRGTSFKKDAQVVVSSWFPSMGRTFQVSQIDTATTSAADKPEKVEMA